jgi:hypothetical protein
MPGVSDGVHDGDTCHNVVSSGGDGAFVAAHRFQSFRAAARVLLALPLRRIDVSLPRSNWLPPTMESARALASLAASARRAWCGLRVAVELPARGRVLSPDGWKTVQRISALVGNDPRVERVHSIVTVLPMERFDLTAFSFAPAGVTSTLVSTDQRATVIEVVPRSSLDFPTLTRLARDTRRRLAADRALPAGTREHRRALALIQTMKTRSPAASARSSAWFCGTLIALLSASAQCSCRSRPWCSTSSRWSPYP